MKPRMTRLHLSLLPLALAGLLVWMTPDAARGQDGPGGEVYAAPLRQAVAGLVVAAEDRTGYERKLFRHWVDADGDGCATRAEVLIEESFPPVGITGKCRIGEGEWWSYYDNRTFTNPGKLDIDHMVPLAEAWDSGASSWSPEERMRYANDLDDPRALLAVTASENRSKADKDPAQWLPEPAALCRYAGEWTAVKLRWGLAADPAEREALGRIAAACPDEIIHVVTARDTATDPWLAA